MSVARPASRVARDSLIVMLLILISRLLGFVRLRATADVFGMSWQTDAFRAAFNVPDLMFFLLVAGGLNAAFIPVFTEYLAKGEEDEAWRVAASFFNLALLVLLAATLLGALFTPFLAPLVAYRFTGDARELLVLLMRVMFPAVMLTAVAGLAMGVHRSYHRFYTAMLGPSVYNLGIIGGAYLLGPRIGIVGMAIGTVAGALANAAMQLPFVIKTARHYRFAIDWRHPGLRRIFALMAPALVSLSIFQINIIISTNLASGLNPGDITALTNADRVMQFPLGVFAMGISLVIFPLMSKQLARGERGAFLATFSRGLRTVLFVTLPAAAGLIALRVPLIRLLFETGHFTSRDTEATAYALTFFAIGLCAQSATQIITQAYYSLHDTRTPMWVGALTLLTNVLFSLALLRYTDLGQGGLALAFSLSSIVNTAAFLIVLKRRLNHIGGRQILRTLALSALASIAVYFVAGAVAAVLAPHLNLAGNAGRLIQVLSAVAAGAGVYALAAVALRMDEVGVVLQMLQRKRS
ncbi:MAG TPA: murein biosynthesis integral membrane protein MurJ [Limnochordia bacterium]|nr:murein biosynthesis integral membrane protein MurJ [Limnochordia bacterium]